MTPPQFPKLNVAPKLGVANIKMLLTFIIDATKYVKDCTRDGKFSWWEAVGSLGLLREGVDALGATSSVISEIKDLDEVEIAELVRHVGAAFEEQNLSKAKDILDNVLMPLVQGVFVILMGIENLKQYVD